MTKNITIALLIGILIGGGAKATESAAAINRHDLFKAAALCGSIAHSDISQFFFQDNYVKLADRYADECCKRNTND